VALKGHLVLSETHECESGNVLFADMIDLNLLARWWHDCFLESYWIEIIYHKVFIKIRNCSDCMYGTF